MGSPWRFQLQEPWGERPWRSDNDPTCPVLMCNGGVFGHKRCAPSFVRFVSTNKYSSKRSWWRYTLWLCVSFGSVKREQCQGGFNYNAPPAYGKGSNALRPIIILNLCLLALETRNHSIQSCIFTSLCEPSRCNLMHYFSNFSFPMFPSWYSLVRVSLGHVSSIVPTTFQLVGPEGRVTCSILSSFWAPFRGCSGCGKGGRGIGGQIGQPPFQRLLFETSILIARWSPFFLTYVTNNDYLGPKYLHDLSTCRLTAANSQPGRMGSECGAQGTRRSRSGCIMQLRDYVQLRQVVGCICLPGEMLFSYSKFYRSSWEEWCNSASIFKLGRWNGIGMAMKWRWMAYFDRPTSIYLESEFTGSGYA